MVLYFVYKQTLNTKTDFIDLICDAGQVLITLFQV